MKKKWLITAEYKAENFPLVSKYLDVLTHKSQWTVLCEDGAEAMKILKARRLKCLPAKTKWNVEEIS